MILHWKTCHPVKMKMFKVDMEWEIGKNKCYICNIYRCNAGMKITKKH